MFSRNSQNGQSFFRFTSFSLTFVFVYLFGVFPFTSALLAAPQYKTFDERGKSQMENYFDRGKTLSTEAQWQNFIDQGVGVSQAQWESEARASLDAETRAIDENQTLDDAQKLAQKQAAQAQFDQAKLDWLSAAADRVISERGKWKAVVGNAFVAEIDDATYQQIITKARTAVLGQDLNLALWDATVAGDNASVESQFQSLLTAEINRIASANLALSGAERTAFDAELAKVESSIRSEFDLKQNFYLRRARNQYIAEKRSDLGSAKSEAEKESAAYMTDQLLKQTWESVNGMTSQALTQAVNAALGQQSADINNLGQDWQRQVEAIVSQGLRSWETAEEDLMEQRIEWANKEKKLLKDGGEIWKAQYERIKAEKEKWLTQVKTQIQQGRAMWDQKYVQFNDERQRADTEFQQLLATENDRWNGYNDKLIDMVTTGGAALAQAQDAVAFYSSVMPDTSDPTVRAFYQQQINYFNGALGTFNTLLSNVRLEMQSTMLSQNADSGYLVDKRVFAGTVPAEIQALGASGFRSALLAKLDTFTEAYVLYDRDLRREIQRADTYAVSSQYVGANLGAWFSGGYNFADVTAKLNSYSDEHANVKSDIQQIWNSINTDNATYPDEASKKAALQTQVQTLLTNGMNVDQSLFNRVTAYFNTPYGGNYLTGNDNDPYLMTQAEYEWELLRNRRNFLSQQLSTAEAVYNYARVANQSGAGLELSQVTREAAEIQKVYTDLAEIKYKILKGDIALNPLVKTDAATRDTQFNNILAARGIDLNKIYTREGQILQEKTALGVVTGAGAVAVGSDLDAIISAFDQWRGTNPATPAGTASNVHYLAQFSDKLIQLKNEWTVGLTGDALLEKQQRWVQLKNAAGALFSSLTDLQGNYRFAELGQKINDVKGAMVPANPLLMNLTELGTQLQTDKSLIEAQAVVVANAKAAFDLQQDIYRQTKKTFDVLALPSSQQVIATEISNLGQQLASVTNRMVLVNGVTEMKDVVTATELDYYRILRERTEAQKDVGYTTKVIQAIDNLKAARQHASALDTILATGFAGKSIDQIATDFRSAEANLIVRTGATANWTKTVELFDGIEAQKNAYLAARTALTTAQGGGNATLIAQREEEALIAAEGLRQNIDGFITALRMEKKINGEALDYLLDSSTALGAGSSTLNATILQKEVGDAVTRTSSQYERLNEAAVNHLAGLVNSVITGGTQAATNSQTLIKAVDDQIAQLMGGTNRATAGGAWNGSSYDFGLFEGKTDTTFNINLEKLWVVRAYLTDLTVKARIDSLSQIPPPGGQTIEQKWQKFYEEVQFYQQKNQIFTEVTQQAPQSATDTWVTNFNNNRTTLRNDLTNLLSAPNDTALKNALTTYLAGMAANQADDTRFILQSYLGHYVNEASTTNLRNDLTNARNGITQELQQLNLNYGAIWAKEQYLSKDRAARNLENQLTTVFNQIAGKGAEIQAIDADILQLTTLKNDAVAAGNAADATAIQTEIDNKNAQKATLTGDITQLNNDAAALRAQIDPLRAYAGEILNRGSSLVMAPFVQNSLWQYRIEEEGYRRLNSEWAAVKDASYRAELAAAEQGLADTIKQVIGFYQKDDYGNIRRDVSGMPLVDNAFLSANNLPLTTPANADISVLLGGNQSGTTLQNWVSALTTYVDRAQAERKNVPDNLKQAIAGLETSLIEYLSAEAFIANRNTTVAVINGNADATKTLETERLKNIAKALAFYQNISNAMSGYDTANGTSPLGAYSAFVTELSKTQNKELLTLFSATATGPDAAVHNSLTELFALGGQLKEVREQLYSAQIQQQFLDARKAAYAQNKVLSVTEFMAGVDVLKTSAIQTSINNITADANFINGVTAYLTGSNASELYLSKLWDIVSAYPANGDPVLLKSNLLAALNSDTFATQIRSELNALSPRDLYAARGSAGAAIDGFIAAQATRADSFRTAFDAYVNSIPGATTTASAVSLINTWLANTANVPAMQQDYAAEITYLMQNLNQTMPLNQFKIELANFTALLANPSATEQQKFGNLALQQELMDALNQYHYAANFNAAGYPVELRNFVLLRGYNDLNTRYQEFLRLKDSAIADEQARAVLDLAGHPQEMQRHFYLNDFYSYLDGSGGAGSAQALDDYMTGASTALSDRTASQFVANYLASRKIDSQVIGSDLVKEFTNIVLHTRASTALGTPVAADINKEAKEFRTRLLMAKFDDYISNNTLTLTGGTPAALLADFKTKFDVFLTDNAYRIGGVDLKDQLAGNIELADFRDKAYAYFNANPTGGGNLSTYLPTLNAGSMSPNTFGAYTRLNADTLLPAALTAIANFKTAGKGYLNQITGANADALKTAYLKLSLASGASTALSNLPPDSAQIAQMISTSGYTLPATVETALNTYFNDMSLASKVAVSGATSPAQALYNLRLAKTVETVFAGDAVKKEGFLTNRANLSAVENASYASLENAPARVRDLAKNNETGFMLAAWMLVVGLALTGNASANTFYSGLSATDKAAFDDYALSLGTKVSAENKKFIGDYVNELQTYLSQPGNSASVLFNGDLAKSESTVRAAAEHLGTPALRAAAKDNFNEFYKAFVQYMQGSGSGVTLGATTVTAADFARMAAELNSQEKGFFKAEQAKLTNFFTQIQETTAERTRVQRLMSDASLSSAVFATDVAWEVKLSKTLAEANLTAITDAIGAKLRNNQAVTTGRQRVFARNMAVADNLKRFAALRGETTNLATGGSLFLNFRSFIKTVADKQAILYTNPTPDMPTYLQGKTLKENVLAVGNLETLFSSGNYQTQLVSDRAPDFSATSTDKVTYLDTNNVSQTVYQATLNKVNADANPDLTVAYQEHLANNFLTAVSNMNRSLASVFAMAETHDASTSLTPGAVNTTNGRRQIVSTELSGAISTYRGASTSSVQALDDLRTAFDGVKQNRSGRLVDDNAATGGLSENVLLGAQKQAEQSSAQVRDSRQQLAEAAHRDVLLGSSARGYLAQTFNQVATDLSTAEVAYNNQVAALNALKNTYATNFTHYTSAMNRMADAFKTFQVENSDFEKKQAIKDFATTAYLFANSSQASSANEADAFQMYLAAKQNYDTVSAQLAAKADEVRTQDTLTQLSDLIQKIDAGTPLNAQETAMRATYQNFIDARKDYVLESERMIRVKKAQEILNAEIEKRKQIAELKLAAYNKAKDDLIGYADPQNTAAVYNRDKTIAAFQALLASGGPDRIAGVIKGMAYIDDMSMNMSGKLFANSGGPEMDEPAVISDWNGHKDLYNNLNPADKALLDQFRANIANGQLNSGNFQAMKAAGVEVLKKKELYLESVIRLNWAWGVGGPLLAAGSFNLGAGNGFAAAAAAAFASLFGAWAGAGLMALAGAHWLIGASLIAGGLALIIPATIDKDNKQNDHDSANRNADDQRNAIVAKLNTIKAKEEEYLAAKAALDYFTKAPSQQVLKERLVQWGTQAGGYQLSDADLRYVKDDKSNYTDSTGATYAAGAHCPTTSAIGGPIAGLCNNDAARALNITSSITTPKFETAAGDKYDPSQVTSQNLESTLEGGFYWLNGEKYVKIKQMNHAGQMTDMYAKYLTADVAPGGVWDMYNLGDVMNMSSNHSDALRSQLKQGYVTAGGSHEQTLMLNEREKTMWSIWNYADAQGKQYKGFQQMAGDYQENSTNVFQVQQQQNAALVTQQWDLRRAELDAARARWENLANTIETRGMESFNASEQKFLKAWRQWEIDTNRKIDAGKKQWDDKMKTFLVSKQNWQDEIKAAAMEQSLEKMLGATGSALNDRLKALSANINIPVDVPEINVANLVQAAMADFERSKPSNERLFGEINKSITAFNVTLELGNATHFKGFNSTSLEGDFASNMETFSKKMAILNNVKMYESFKKLIEDFKESLRKNDQNVTAGLTTAATLANYRQDGGWYTKDMGWAFGGKYGFSAYQHADVDGLMNRGMREAGMTIMSGDEMVNFLEKGRDVDVKLFFEVQTMALEQAFKIVGGDKSKKGLYGEWVGEAPQYNNDGDESNQGSGELGGWAGGQMDNKKTYRGLNKEEKRLSTIQGSITAAMNVTASLAAAATGNVALLVTLAGTQATYSTGSAIASGRDAGGSLAMGAIDFGIAFGGALMGPGVGATAIRSSLNFARAGIAQNPDGTVNLDFKGNWSKGGGASAAFSGAMSVLGEAAGGSIGKTRGEGWGALASGAFGAVGAGMRFDSGGVSGFSVSSAIGSGIGSAVSYGLNPGNTKSEWNYGGKVVNQILASEIGKAAEAVTTTLLGAAMNDSRAAASFTSTYQNVNGFSAMGGLLGRVVQKRIEENRTLDAARQARETGQPLTQDMLAALALMAVRRREEQDEDAQQNGIGGDDLADDNDALLGLKLQTPNIEEVELLKEHFKNNVKFGANDQLLTELAERGTLNEGDVAEIVAAQVANYKQSETKAEKFVPTGNPDAMFEKLAKAYGASKEEMLLRWVPANTGDEHDISTPEGFEAAQRDLYAKLNKGGMINVPQGFGEYTAAFDKASGYAGQRAQMVRGAIAELGNTAGMGSNNKWLLGMDSIIGRQGLNLTSSQALQLELGMVNVNRALAAEHKVAQGLYGTSLSNGIDPLFMGNNSFVRMSFTGKTPVELLTKPQVITEKLTFTGWEQVPNPANVQAFKALSANTEMNLALGMANAVSTASGVRAAYMLAKLGYAAVKAGAAAKATEELTAIQMTGLLTGNWTQAGAFTQSTMVQTAGAATGSASGGGLLKALFPNPVTQATYGGVNAMGSAYWDLKQTGSINPVNALISFGTGGLTGPGGYPTQTLAGAFAYNALWSGIGNVTSQAITNGGFNNFSWNQFGFQTAFGGISGVTQQMIGQSATLSGANQIQRWREEGMNMGLWWYSPLIAPK